MKCGSFYNGRKSFLGNDTKSLLDIVPFTVSLNSCRLLEQRSVSGTVSSHGGSSSAGRKGGVFAHGRPADRQALLPRHAVIRVVLLRNGGRDMSAHEGPYEEAQRSRGSDALHDQPCEDVGGRARTGLGGRGVLGPSGARPLLRRGSQRAGRGRKLQVCTRGREPLHCTVGSHTGSRLGARRALRPSAVRDTVMAQY